MANCYHAVCDDHSAVAAAAVPPAAPQGHAIKAGEVLLSSGCYHSPMHLVSGEFRLAFPGRVVVQQPPQALGSRAAGCPSQAQMQAQAATGGGEMQGQQAAVYTCRRAFDASTGSVAPLRRALDGFSVPA